MLLSMFPPIQSPCPLKSIQLPETGNFHCSACQREVYDLSAMSIAERETFLSACNSKVCISYKVKATKNILKKGAIAGLFVVSATGLALQAAADEEIDIGQLPDEEEYIIMGGITLPENAADAEQQDSSRQLQPDLELIPVIEEVDIPKNI